MRRLLGDAKTNKPRILRFFREYFGYDKANDVFKEANSGGQTIDFPGHDAATLVADTDRLIEYILEQDRDVLRVAHHEQDLRGLQVGGRVKQEAGRGPQEI